ncbi:trigger factor [Companilactobacillus sp. RD055328]|uniref:trigger factor n=1 Tax=Companilactobacillus sp. RD055328 TaxID=2916634 RepID=UPI001FC8709B|nr:trigger factor [Companilactobacillus sp. RD055328]GKQ42806.1 trigger factor [Companilactobacillus sp. RD055328]
MASKAKWTKKGKTDGELTFEIDRDTISKGLDIAFKKVRKNLNAPGFRKGKMPRQIFNKMYGEAALYEEALNAVLPEAYNKAIEDTKIEPVDQPKIDVDSLSETEPWVLKATVTVKPEVKLGDYKGLEVPKQKTTVTKKMVEDELENTRKQQAELVLKEDAAAADGDTVVIDYTGTVDGKEFDGGSAKNYSLELGSNSFIPGFEEQLVGHKASEDVTVKVTFPKDYHANDLAGKEAEFATTIHEVKEKQLPELDDDFAKDVDENVENLDQLKENIKAEIKKRMENDAENAIQEAATSAAVKNAKIDEIPEAMINTEVDNQMNQYMNTIQSQGMNPEMYFQLTGTTEADLRDQFKKDAETRVKTDLVLEAVVAAEKIKPTKKDVDDEIKSLAGQYNMEESVVRQALTDDMVKHDVSVKKALDIIVDSAVQK